VRQEKRDEISKKAPFVSSYLLIYLHLHNSSPPPPMQQPGSWRCDEAEAIIPRRPEIWKMEGKKRGSKGTSKVLREKEMPELFICT
jgi:hypothetical protein